MSKVLSMVCKCLNKVVCICNSVLAAPAERRNIKIAQRALEEWKRIEGVGFYNRKRDIKVRR